MRITQRNYFQRGHTTLHFLYGSPVNTLMCLPQQIKQHNDCAGLTNRYNNRTDTELQGLQQPASEIIK
jgi:hypothetical protein